ncbi:MAG: hypothetical protein RIQ93_3398, partial [Verrucomicrobiota bacterium]
MDAARIRNSTPHTLALHAGGDEMPKKNPLRSSPRRILRSWQLMTKVATTQPTPITGADAEFYLTADAFFRANLPTA